MSIAANTSLASLGSVSTRGLIDRQAEIDLPRLTLRHDFQRLFVVERQTELTCENVCSAARNYGETCVRARKALNGFVDRAVAAGNDHVRTAVVSGARCELGRVTWSVRHS